MWQEPKIFCSLMCLWREFGLILQGDFCVSWSDDLNYMACLVLAKRGVFDICNIWTFVLSQGLLWPDANHHLLFSLKCFFFIWEKPLHCKGKLSIDNSFEVCKPVDKKEAAICVVFITELWYSFQNLFSLRIYLVFSSCLLSFFFWSLRISLPYQKNFPLPLPHVGKLLCVHSAIPSWVNMSSYESSLIRKNFE